MIEGGWAYVWGAYVLTIVTLGALALVTATRSRRWETRARELDEGSPR
jgi:heme exporter protein CcmD